MTVKATKKEAKYVGLEIDETLPRIDIFVTYIERYESESIKNYKELREKDDQSNHINYRSS